MLDLLALQGAVWHDFTPSTNPNHVPIKIMVPGLDVVPKVWTYFLHHNLETNRSGSYLITIRVFGLYLILTRQPINLG